MSATNKRLILNPTFDMSMDLLWGYRIDDYCVNMPLIPPIKVGIKTLEKNKNKEFRALHPRGVIPHAYRERAPVSANLGVNIKSVCPVLPDFGDNVSFKAGFYYRVCRGTPIPDKSMLRSARKFVRHMLLTGEVEQMSNEDVTYCHWRVIINFPESRKLEFDKAKNLLDLDLVTKNKYLEVKGFCKEEDYNGEFKHFRTINARSDYFKVDVGPFFKQLESKFFKLPEFIKKIPQHQRAQYIMEKVYAPGGKYICTDYTSFESGFRAEVMDAIEYEVYHFIGRGHTEFSEFWRKIQVLKHTNRIHYKSFQADVPATRMSGEMNTSLGNGIFNYFAFRFACYLDGIEVRGVVEGDDGLNHVTREPDVRTFEKLGMIIKYEKFDNIGDASFCGQVFDPTAMQIVRDPIQTLIKMGWSTRKYINANVNTKRALLRSKAMSALYENPGCPIVNKFCIKILELTSDKRTVTRECNLRRIERNQYLRDRNSQMEDYLKTLEGDDMAKFRQIFQEPHPLTRDLVERRWKITVAEQIITELQIEAITELGEFDLPFIVKYATQANLIANDVYRNVVEPYIPHKILDGNRNFNVAEDFFDNSHCKVSKMKFRKPVNYALKRRANV